MALDIAVGSDHDQEIPVPDFKRDLLGDDNIDSTVGPPVHELIAEKWSSIFSTDLSKESKALLLIKIPSSAEFTYGKGVNTELRYTAYNSRVSI